MSKYGQACVHHFPADSGSHSVQCHGRHSYLLRVDGSLHTDSHKLSSLDQPKGSQPMAARPVDALQTPVWDAVPDKKAGSKLGEKKPKIEMAVDTIKKKKKKTTDMTEKVSILITCVCVCVCIVCVCVCVCMCVCVYVCRQ